MEILLVLVVLVLAGVVGALVLRQRRAATEQATARETQRARPVDPLAPETALSDPSRIQPGDVVHFDLKQWVVRGTISLDEGGDRWQEHLMDSGEETAWLSVEPGEGDLEVALWNRVLDPDLQPGASSLAHAGKQYTRVENGTANFTAIGTTGTSPSGRMEYYDYEDGARLLAFERTEGRTSWEVSEGRTLRVSELDIYHRS